VTATGPGICDQPIAEHHAEWVYPMALQGDDERAEPAEPADGHQVEGDTQVVLNNVAKSINERQRGINKEWVFPYNGTAMHRMNDSAWKKARVRASKLWQEENLRPAHLGYASIRIHDLKHTFGPRLRAAGVTEEDRK